MYQVLFRKLLRSDIEIVLSARQGYTDSDGLVERIVNYGREHGIKATLSVSASEETNEYYKGLQFTVKTVINGNTYTIGDGGFVDWPNRLLSRRRERMLISAIGLDRLVPELARTSL